MKNYAYRNIKLCTKDCLCLFVCPTGATDTETGQIDFSKCIGCGACAQACPSRAITMLPNIMPAQQNKDIEVIKQLFKIADNKIEEIGILKKTLNDHVEDERLYKALLHSNKVMIEDIMREAGYMLPQSKNTAALLQTLACSNDAYVKNIANKLINLINVNE